MNKGHSDTTTDGIRIRVGAQFMPNESDAERREHAFVYRVVITNLGGKRARLLSRHWIIRDGDNERRDVKGPGVVGQQPNIEPGASFEYMSRCILPTDWGTMEGSYTMQREDGSTFEAKIGRFFLARSAAPISTIEA